MEKILLNLSIILFAVYFYKKIRHGLHILQLENYYNDRYAVWMKKNIKTVLNIKIIGMLAIPIILLAINQTNIASGYYRIKRYQRILLLHLKFWHT